MLLTLSISAAAFVFLLLGNFHVVRGSAYGGPTLLPKSTFGFSETFINTDALTGLPYIAATTRYPLSVKALQNSGFLETDAAREARIKNEINMEYQQVMRESREEYERMLRDYEMRH